MVMIQEELPVNKQPWSSFCQRVNIARSLFSGNVESCFALLPVLDWQEKVLSAASLPTRVFQRFMPSSEENGTQWLVLF